MKTIIIERQEISTRFAVLLWNILNVANALDGSLLEKNYPWIHDLARAVWTSNEDQHFWSLLNEQLKASGISSPGEANWKEEVDRLKVTLNSDYIAEVGDNAITVGCQSLSFEKFDELAKAVAKKRNEHTRPSGKAPKNRPVRRKT